MRKPCPECGCIEICCNGNIGEVVCRSCGLVLDEFEIINQKFVSEASKKHASRPGTSVAGGQKINGKITKDSWFTSTREKNKRDAMRRITFASERLNLPKYVIDDAKGIFSEVLKNELNIGRGNSAFVYASVYLACKMHGIPKIPLEFAISSSVNRTQIMRACKMIQNKLNIALPSVDYIDYVQRFGSDLKLQQETITLASELAMNLKGKQTIAGKNPQTVVATCLYLASKLNNNPRTQRDVSNATGVLEITMRKLAKEVIKELDLVV